MSTPAFLSTDTTLMPLITTIFTNVCSQNVKSDCQTNNKNN